MERTIQVKTSFGRLSVKWVEKINLFIEREQTCYFISFPLNTFSNLSNLGFITNWQ
jgi:hypothetical protein